MYLVVYTNMPMCFYTIVPMPFRTRKGQRPWSFYLGHFSLSNFFDNITKDANILHLKSGSSYKLNYFSTSTPSRHISNHNGQLIANHWFLIYKYCWPTTSGWLWTWKDFDTYFEPTWHPVTSPFSLILLFYTFS
jgi:hypothetical protein